MKEIRVPTPDEVRQMFGPAVLIEHSMFLNGYRQALRDVVARANEINDIEPEVATIGEVERALEDAK